MRTTLEFPNGRVQTMVGDRGRKCGMRAKKYKVIVFKAWTDESGHVIAAEIGYRGNFWQVNRYGAVRRVSNGKYVTLCDFAYFPANMYPDEPGEYFAPNTPSVR